MIHVCLGVGEGVLVSFLSSLSVVEFHILCIFNRVTDFKACRRQWGGNGFSVSAECSEIMQTRIEYAGAQTSQHISHAETFKNV